VSSVRCGNRFFGWISLQVVIRLNAMKRMNRRNHAALA
jgi:hypothetical protein